MSKIRSKDTKPELIVRKRLFAEGFRYKLHDKKLPGKPDLVFPKYKTVIFINGCFWHGHKDCRYFVVPKTRTEWWLNKINTNKGNDEKAAGKLKEAGWDIVILWECELKANLAERTLKKVIQKIRSDGRKEKKRKRAYSYH